MKIKYEKEKIVLMMIIAYALFCIGIAKSIPLHTSTDELGTIAGAALIAGRDWSDVISCCGYYGFGYYSLFFWLFRITNSPIVIYRVIILTTVLLRVMIIPIAYYIAKEYLGINSEKMLFLSAFLMPFCYSTSMGVITNEYVLELLIWIVMLLMCKVAQYHDKKIKQNLYGGLLLLVCLYLQFIHTRALTLLIAVTITIVAYGIIEKKLNVVGMFLIGIPVVCFGAKKIVSFYQQKLYGKTGGEITNGSVQISNIGSLFDFDTWDVWIHMFIGMIDTEIILTGGLFLVCIVTFLFYIKKILSDRFCEVNIFLNMVISVSILCMGATIVAFMFSNWFEGILEDWQLVDAGSAYAFKGLTYVRYWNIYMPPFILCALSLFKNLDYLQIINVSAVILVILHIFFIQKILPLIQENGAAASPFHGMEGFHRGDVVNKEFYYKCLMISIMCFLLAFMLLHSQYKYNVLLLIIALLIFCQTRKILYFDADVKNQMSAKIMTSYEEKERLHKTGVHIDQIYLQDTTQTKDRNWQLYSIAQFYFNDYTLHMELPEELGRNDVIISTGKSEEIEHNYQNILCYELDENEIWYTYLMLQ